MEDARNVVDTGMGIMPAGNSAPAMEAGTSFNTVPVDGQAAGGATGVPVNGTPANAQAAGGGIDMPGNGMAVQPAGTPVGVMPAAGAEMPTDAPFGGAAGVPVNGVPANAAAGGGIGMPGNGMAVQPAGVPVGVMPAAGAEMPVNGAMPGMAAAAADGAAGIPSQEPVKKGNFKKKFAGWVEILIAAGLAILSGWMFYNTRGTRLLYVDVDFGRMCRYYWVPAIGVLVFLAVGLYTLKRSGKEVKKNGKLE